MGSGNSYICSNCGKNYSFMSGFGMLFPNEYKKTVKNIRDGKFGKEWKELYGTGENIAVDAQKRIYCCPKCGSWKSEQGLSLYEAADDRAVKDVKSGYPILYGDDSMPAIMGRMPEYRLLKEWEHICVKCQCKMHEVSAEELRHLKCPGCGGAPDPEQIGIIMWD